jgi:hypothetical protein
MSQRQWEGSDTARNPLSVREGVGVRKEQVACAMSMRAGLRRRRWLPRLGATMAARSPASRAGAAFRGAGRCRGGN